ncbi:hypothetical protein TRIUR3_06760 [Triticum urartu]|uniref:KIB1-4 beta-propeller domain-containing protein n=1 Tax=Triticum urartu TaxID=4572 RepID=M7ZTB7_TRIUA|nr:uncharacterized protein LOC125515670 [Triticum urartu]EMS62876.1 hypothetical protein TRIUR3_06760 [Triticum urartu]
MQSPSKLSDVSLPWPHAFSGPQGWADLPDGLLHSVVARLGSFRDLLGFAATCPSWRAAFSSYPSKSMLRSKFPPLLIQPHVRVQGPLLPAANGCHQLYTCVVIDPANKKTSLRCQIPVETTEKMIYIGSSYGNIIYFCYGYVHIVDVFTGVEVSTPRLPSSVKRETFYLNGILTSPLTSPNSHLLVSTEFSLFDLLVGSDSWSQVQLPHMLVIDQIVEFNGQVIVSDGFHRFYTLQLAPQLGLQEMTTKFQDRSEDHRRGKTWLVVCGGMLLMVTAFSFNEVYCLDMSTKPATWMAVEKLDNWALFLGEEVKSTPLSCMSSELFGLGSNILLYAGLDSKPWNLHHLCGGPDPMHDTPPDAGDAPEPWGWDSPLPCASLGPWWVTPALACTSLEPWEWDSPALPCMSPEPWWAAPALPCTSPYEWGGWNNTSHSDPWHLRRPPPFWLYPSMFYSCGQ